jgi:peptidoglycan lytic transglycosylase G
MKPGRVARLGLLLLLAAAFAAAGLFAWIRAPFHGFPGRSATVEFPIGTSTQRIFRRLAGAGVVRNALAAEIYYRILHHGETLLAGEYSFDGSETLEQVIFRIRAGEVVRHSVVVPEGLTDEETFSLYLAQRVGTRRGFERSVRETAMLSGASPDWGDLEGFLFPDTYVVTRSTPTREIVFRMVQNFDRHFTPEMRTKAGGLGLTLRQAVTLASLVEKETSLPSERPHIAAVYLNRLRLGMRLQCDPSVIYSLERDGRWTGRLRRSDLDYDSPYNTYRFAGLPPGPICNPGAASLAASVEPSDAGDLYFVARGDGGHYFSRSYEDHLKMIERSRANSALEEESR